MKQLLIVSMLLLLVPLHKGIAEVLTFGSFPYDFEIEFVEVGDAGNPNGPLGLGGIDYAFSMAKFEISRDMIDVVALAGGPVIPLGDMRGKFPTPEMPATEVTWNHAARFANWLNDVQGHPPAYRFERAPDEEPFLGLQGILLWEEGSPEYDPDNPFRNRLARFALPTVDEWQKAAYYDPDEDRYWRHPVGSDEPPTLVASGVEPGTAVLGQPSESSPADITAAGGLSPYGVMALGGNVWEWIETTEDGTNSEPWHPRYLRGGCWANSVTAAGRTNSSFEGHTSSHHCWGFRVVMLSDSTFELGDFNFDGLISDIDIDLLTDEVTSMSNNSDFDLTEDGIVDEKDRVEWVEEIAKTNYGDADLNGIVEFPDFLLLSDSFNQMNGWTGGDFDGNGTTEFGDFLILSENFGLSRESDQAAVREPSASFLLLFGALPTLLWRRFRR